MGAQCNPQRPRLKPQPRPPQNPRQPAELAAPALRRFPARWLWDQHLRRFLSAVINCIKV